jgi:PAS domain-containing protein
VGSTPDARRSEHEARFGASREGVAVLSPEWRIRYMNASMLEILRLIGRGAAVETLWDALPGWEHSDPADTLRHAMATGAAVCFRVDGERGRGRVWEVQADPLESGDLRLRVRNVTVQARVDESGPRFGADLSLGELLEMMTQELRARLGALDTYAAPDEPRKMEETRRRLLALIDSVRSLAEVERGPPSDPGESS